MTVTCIFFKRRKVFCKRKKVFYFFFLYIPLVLLLLSPLTQVSAFLQSRVVFGLMFHTEACKDFIDTTSI